MNVLQFLLKKKVVKLFAIACDIYFSVNLMKFLLSRAFFGGSDGEAFFQKAVETLFDIEHIPTTILTFICLYFSPAKPLLFIYQKEN